MKIICVGRNYVEHIKELNNEAPKDPVLFLKPDTSILLKKQPFFIPEFSNEVHHEVEILVKINRIGKHIDRKFAHKYYDEIGLGIDFTARDLQSKLKEKGLPWEKAKAFDITTLYYSGSILSNQSSSYEFSSPLEGKNAVGSQTREALVEDSFRSNIPTSGLENGLRQNELYNEISNQFRSFDTSGRKKIQRCLRYGSYQGKIDGLWGNQTFDAIVSFDETSKLAIQVTEEHIFSKLKNIFSNKKFCYNLIADSFQL